MDLNVRQMQLDEVGFVIDYFYYSSPEHLEMLGVDPTKLPPREQWLDLYTQEYSSPIEQRRSILLIWTADDIPIGFSATDKIVFGKEAYMHLHIVSPQHRKTGYGAECVRRSVGIYFDVLKLEHLFCEPNAFNVPPNRTLQAAGFKYLKTHMTVPGPLNYHQAVTRWVIER